MPSEQDVRHRNGSRHGDQAQTNQLGSTEGQPAPARSWHAGQRAEAVTGW